MPRLGITEDESDHNNDLKMSKSMFLIDNLENQSHIFPLVGWLFNSVFINFHLCRTSLFQINFGLFSATASALSRFLNGKI